MVLCIVLPIIYIDIRKAGDEELELLLVENCNQFSRDDIMESCYTLVICRPNLKT